MPRYTFKLNDDDGGLEDDIGINLPDAEAAYGYAHEVVRELMKGRESITRCWRLDVYEDDHKIFEIQFASIDDTLEVLPRPRSRG